MNTFERRLWLRGHFIQALSMRFQRLPRSIRAALIRGGDRHECPLCGEACRFFLPHGASMRWAARCGLCGSLERHRLDWLYMQKRTNLLDGRPKRVLHVAPEAILEQAFRAVPGVEYVSADLRKRSVMIRTSVTGLPFFDDTFDAIYCSHVLEHVPDDRRALAELHRVLRPDGWALIQVPMFDRPTFEDPAITSPEGRERAFGQHDHVRAYGPDFRDRLQSAGFLCEAISAHELLGIPACGRYGVQASRRVFRSCKASRP